MIAALALLTLGPGPLAPTQGAAAIDTAVLDKGQAERVRERVLPSAEELRFEEIPWVPAFGAGLVRANEERLPVLFWAMNGHPLGCT